MFRAPSRADTRRPLHRLDAPVIKCATTRRYETGHIRVLSAENLVSRAHVYVRVCACVYMCACVCVYACPEALCNYDRAWRR